jgi:hypothetical protein
MASILSSFSSSNKPFSIATEKKSFHFCCIMPQQAVSSREQLQLLANNSTIRLMIDPCFDNCVSYQLKFVAKGSRRSVQSQLFIRLNVTVLLQ